MNLLSVLIVPIIVVSIVIYITISYLKKEDLKKQQKHKDACVLNQLLVGKLTDITLGELCKYSSKQEIASIVASMIVNSIHMGVHPKQLAWVLNIISNPNTNKFDEPEISGLIQKNVLELINTRDLDTYTVFIQKDLEKGIKQLNESFLVRTQNDMLVVSSFK